MIVEAGGFAEDFESTGCEDWDLWLRLGVCGARLVTLQRVGAYYRRYEGSMSTQSAGMLVNRIEVLLRLQQKFLDRPDLLKDWGGELVEAEHRVRRRCIAQGMDGRWLWALSRAIRVLTKRGICLPRSPGRRVLETVVGGSTADRLILAYFRRYKPMEFSTYENDFM
jgi:hypothetical protein